jgi:hypothetical protein
MRKVGLLFVLLLCLLQGTARGQNIRLSADQYDIVLPEGKVHFPLNAQKLIIKFREGFSEAAIQQYFKSSDLLKGYKAEWKVPLPGNIYRVELKDGISLQQAHTAISQSNDVIYTAPVVWYKDMEQSLMDDFLVKVNTPADMQMLRQLATQFSFNVEKELDKDIYTCRITKATPGNAFEVAKYLQSLNKFEFVEPDFIYTCKGTTNDTYYGNQWGINNTGQYSGTAGSDMDVVNAWTITTGNSNIRVAVLDCFGSINQFYHPDVTFADTFDAPGGGYNSSGFTGDAHGINCAGIISAIGNNNAGTVGVAYNARVVAVKLGTITNSSGNWNGTTTTIASGINWAHQNADVISNSNTFGSSSSTINTAISNALTLGRGGLGVLFFSSNGNSNTTTIGYPASNTNTIAVAATTQCDTRKSPTSCDTENWGSDYGTGTDVGAPGVKWHSTDLTGSAGYSSTDYFQYMNGTSSACPAAAAVMALMLSVNPGLTAANARQMLESTCEKVGGYTYTAGVAGQPNGTWSTNLGYGRINAYQAVMLANCTPAARTITPAGPLTICSGQSATLTVSNTCTGCTYNWSNGATGVSTSVNTSGNYTVTATNTCGTSPVSNTVNITVNPLPVIPTVTPAGPLTICANQSSTLTVSNPCSGCTFNWSNGATGTTNSVNTAGLYTATATNSCGTSAAGNAVSLTVNPLPVVPVVDPVGPLTICSGQSATLNVTNACTGCTYTWSNSATGTSNTVNSTGSYTATATNSCGTSAASNSVAVTVNPLPVTPIVSPGGPVTICQGQSSTLNITNACTGCTFTWSNSATGTSTSVNSAGNYTATATNSCGTSANSNSVAVNVNPLPVIPVVTPAGPVGICSGQPASLSVSNQCTGCTINWSNGATGTINNVNTPGTYTATATNSCGTSANSNGVIVNVTTQPNAPTSATPSQSICAGQSATLTVSGTLTTGAAWHWYSGSCGGTAVGTGNSITVTPGATTTYFVRAENGSCMSACLGTTVTVNQLPTANAGVDQTTCSGIPVSIGSTAVNGNTYNWLPATGLNNVQSANPTTTLTNSTTYTLTVTNTASGCQNTDQVTVSVNPLPIVDAGAAISVVQGNSTTIGGNPTASGNGPFTYSWSPAGTLDDATIANPLATPTVTTTYTVTVTDDNGCVSSNNTVTITVTPPCVDPVADFSASQTSGNCPLSVDFTDMSAASGNATYEWTIYVDGGAPLVLNTQNPAGIVYNEQGSFSVQLKVTDTCGTNTKTVQNFITVTCPTNVGTVDNTNKIDIYPNPIADIVNISADNILNGDYQVHIQNMLGQTIMTKNVKVQSGKLNESISLAPYASGIYTLQVKGTSLNLSRKIEKKN